MNARDSDSMLRLSADVTHYYYLYIVLGALIVAMLLFGAVYESFKRKYGRPTSHRKVPTDTVQSMKHNIYE